MENIIIIIITTTKIVGNYDLMTVLLAMFCAYYNIDYKYQNPFNGHLVLVIAMILNDSKSIFKTIH